MTRTWCAKMTSFRGGGAAAGEATAAEEEQELCVEGRAALASRAAVAA